MCARKNEHEGAPAPTWAVPSKERLAEILFAALSESGARAVITGDPKEALYFEGDLIAGVLLDGLFDFGKVAELLIARLEEGPQSACASSPAPGAMNR
jgi:hypothetical protein